MRSRERKSAIASNHVACGHMRARSTKPMRRLVGVALVGPTAALIAGSESSGGGRMGFGAMSVLTRAAITPCSSFPTVGVPR